MTSPIGRWLTALTVSLTLTAGCSSGSAPDDASATTRPTTTATTTPQQADEAAVRKLAQDWYRESNALLVRPDPRDPILGRYLTGRLLDFFRAFYARQRADGLSVRARPNARSSNRVISVTVNGDRAGIRECLVDDAIVYRRATGEVVNDEVATSVNMTTAVRTGGVWRLAERVTASDEKGITGCALGR